MTKTKRPNAKRLDGKKKLVTLTSRMEADLRSFCRDKGIESESELVRCAIAGFIYKDYEDETLKLKALQELVKKADTLIDMNELFFSYLRLMHVNILSYNPEIDPQFADAAFKSANYRHDKFWKAFQDSLKNNPPFFERLLHNYYTEDK